jgi:hypothetical protein
MTLYRKIGGIHWLSLGRLRISFCFTNPNPAPCMAKPTKSVGARAKAKRVYNTYTRTVMPDGEVRFALSRTSPLPEMKWRMVNSLPESYPPLYPWAGLHPFPKGGEEVTLCE